MRRSTLPRTPGGRSGLMPPRPGLGREASLYGVGRLVVALLFAVAGLAVALLLAVPEAAAEGKVRLIKPSTVNNSTRLKVERFSRPFRYFVLIVASGVTIGRYGWFGLETLAFLFGAIVVNAAVLWWLHPSGDEAIGAGIDDLV